MYSDIHLVMRIIFHLSTLWIATYLPKLDLLCNLTLFLYGYQNWDLWILQCNQLIIDISVGSKDILKFFFYPININVCLTLELLFISLKSKHRFIFLGWSTPWLRILRSERRIFQPLPHFASKGPIWRRRPFHHRWSVLSQNILIILFYPIKNNVCPTPELFFISLKSKHRSIFLGW